MALFICTDHPRIRGEHVAEMFKFPLHPGSSPHTRGARNYLQYGSEPTRIIPAYAGSTTQAVPSWPWRSDHPRIRGEHGSSSVTIIWSMGSSPHTRGALGVVAADGRQKRIIPAYAGSTYWRHRQTARRKDHPRIRGEHDLLRFRRVVLEWIIPAYAGSTRSPWI